MSHKRQRSPSRSAINKRTDSYERHHHSISSNRSYDSSVSIDEIISHCEKYPPETQSLVRELLLEQKKRKLLEERLNLCEHDYALLHTQHEQTMNSLTLLKHDFQLCRLDLTNAAMELNDLRYSNNQYRLRFDQIFDNERQQMVVNDERFRTKRQQRH